MILETITRQLDAIHYDGTNIADVEKMIKRHASYIDWQTDPQGNTRGYLQTINGTVDIVRGIWLAAGQDDQVFTIHPREIGESYPAVYRKVADEGVVEPYAPPRLDEPVVEPSREERISDLSQEERIARLETLLIEFLNH